MLLKFTLLSSAMRWFLDRVKAQKWIREKGKQKWMSTCGWLESKLAHNIYLERANTKFVANGNGSGDVASKAKRPFTIALDQKWNLWIQLNCNARRPNWIKTMRNMKNVQTRKWCTAKTHSNICRYTVSFLRHSFASISPFVIIIYSLHNFFCLWKDRLRARSAAQRQAVQRDSRHERSRFLSSSSDAQPASIALFEPAWSEKCHSLLRSCAHFYFRPIYYILTSGSPMKQSKRTHIMS